MYEKHLSSYPLQAGGRTEFTFLVEPPGVETLCEQHKIEYSFRWYLHDFMTEST